MHSAIADRNHLPKCASQIVIDHFSSLQLLHQRPCRSRQRDGDFEALRYRAQFYLDKPAKSCEGVPNFTMLKFVVDLPKITDVLFWSRRYFSLRRNGLQPRLYT